MKFSISFKINLLNFLLLALIVVNVVVAYLNFDGIGREAQGISTVAEKIDLVVENAVEIRGKTSRVPQFKERRA